MTELINKKIAIVEDDDEIRLMLEEFFQSHSMKTTSFRNGQLFIDYYQDNTSNFDLIITDILMPQMDGLTMCKKLRAIDLYTPLIMLTSVSEDIDKIIGLEVGADDYISKPFNIRVLLASIKSILRRHSLKNQSTLSSKVENQLIYKFDEFRLQTSTRTLECEINKISIQLNSSIYDLLICFLENPNIVLSRERILDQLGEVTIDHLDRSIDVKISRLRQILSKKIISTVRGGGYIFNQNVIVTS